jgi:hypothetical protein
MERMAWLFEALVALVVRLAADLLVGWLLA